MDEAEFWGRLEYRVCREFNGIVEFQKLGLWCDGFAPGDYDLNETPPRIRGVAWICPGQDQQSWQFTLVVNQVAVRREMTDWGALLPAENVTKWLSLDFEAKHIELEPGAAVPDAP